MESRRKKILIIDDDEDTRAVLIDLFQAKGYEAIEAENGVRGFNQALREEPDIILLDIAMPDTSGHAVWSQIRKDKKIQEIPILIVSGKAQANDIYWGEAMPQEDYFHKPYDPDKLLKRIAEKIAERDPELEGASVEEQEASSFTIAC